MIRRNRQDVPARRRPRLKTIDPCVKTWPVVVDPSPLSGHRPGRVPPAKKGGPCSRIRIGGWPNAPIRPLGRGRSTVMSMPTTIGQEEGGVDGHPAVAGRTLVAPARTSFPQRHPVGPQRATKSGRVHLPGGCGASHPGWNQVFTVMTRPCGPVCTAWRLGDALWQGQCAGRPAPSGSTAVARPCTRPAAPAHLGWLHPAPAPRKARRQARRRSGPTLHVSPGASVLS